MNSTARIDPVVIAIDALAMIRVWSPSAERLLGWSARATLGTPASTYLRDVPVDAGVATISATTRDGNVLPMRAHTWVQNVGDAELRFLGLSVDAPGGAASTPPTVPTASDGDMLNRILDHLPVGVWIADRTGAMLICNPQGRHLLTLLRELGQGPRRAWWSRNGREIGPTDWPVEKAIATGESTHLVEISVAPAEGGPITLQQSAVPFRDEHGDIIGAIAVVSDITRKKALEESLQQSNDQLEAVLAAISSILIGIDADERVILWNTAAEASFGVKASRVIGLPARDALGLREWEQVRPRLHPGADAIRMDDIGHRDADGRERILAFVVTAMGDGAKPSGWLMCGADITDRRQGENRQWQAQKLQSIGELAAGVAHEINTPLQFITDNTRFMQDFLGDLLQLLARYRACAAAHPPSAPDHAAITALEAKVDLDFITEEGPRAISQTLEGIEHVSRIVQALRELSHPGDEPTDIDLNRTISSAIALSRNEWKYVAELETELEDPLPAVSGLRGGLNQALLNIIVNAAQAIAGRTDAAKGRMGRISVSTRSAGDAVEVRIRDDGPGIPEHVKARIYDPFFTTKPVGKGTGQGLAIAHTVIVEKCLGTLSCESEVGKGTTFVILLPLARSLVTRGTGAPTGVVRSSPGSAGAGLSPAGDRTPHS